MSRIRLLLHNGVTPLVVFDGDKLPAKAGTDEQRQRCDRGQMLSSTKCIVMPHLKYKCNSCMPAHYVLPVCWDRADDYCSAAQGEQTKNVGGSLRQQGTLALHWMFIRRHLKPHHRWHAHSSRCAACPGLCSNAASSSFEHKIEHVLRWFMDTTCLG